MNWRRLLSKLKWHDWLFVAALIALAIGLLQPPTISGGPRPRTNPTLGQIEDGRSDGAESSATPIDRPDIQQQSE